jgi:CubicO group peptidase (beta-lactamase class C family)
MPFDCTSFVRSIENKKLSLMGIIVRQHGEIIAEHRWKPDERTNLRSVAKSVTSLAVGIAIEEGLLSLDETMAEAFAQFMPKSGYDEKLSRMTLRHLLTLTTGHAKGLLPPNRRDNIDDWLGYILAKPIEYEPGTHFVYNNADPYLAGSLIKMRTGQQMTDWLRPRLFEPLGINNPQWFVCPQGRNICMGGLFLNNDELSRIAQLCLDGGMWKKRRLVPEQWLKQAMAYQVSTQTGADTPESPAGGDFLAGYGFWFWKNQTMGCRMNGRYGNFGIILPKKNAVVAVVGREEKHQQKLLDCVWEEILPQL